MGIPIDREQLLSFPLDDFRGGMRMDLDPSKLGDGEYFFLSNGRNRKGVITPVKLPLEYNVGLPEGNFQGCYGAGTFLVVFVSGKAYYRNFAGASEGFTWIRGFQLDASVAVIFAALVPASVSNFNRKLDVSAANKGITLTTSSSGSPVCLVCQDGINQPWLIFSDGSSRVSQTFAQWTLDNTAGDKREYLPVGKQMLYTGDGILYIVSPDGKELYRSVTGRPLDFVIAIDANLGNKLDDGLFSVEASRMSHKVDFDSITCLGIMTLDNSDSTVPAGFFVSTDKVCRKVTPDFQNTIYGEPTFRNSDLFAAGSLNQFCYIPDLLGDSVFIDSAGLRSFNAVRQFRFEGNNAPFSQSIYPLFEGIIQDFAACIAFENYGVLAVNTVYGYGVLWYDTLVEKFVSLDLWPGIEGVKQFAVIKVNKKYRLFFITVDNKLYEALAGETTATVVFYPREWMPSDIETEHSLNRVRVVMQNSKESGEITLTDYCDRVKGKTLETSINQIIGNSSVPLEIPFGPSTKDAVQDLSFPFSEASLGNKIGVLFVWNCLCEFRSLVVISDAFQALITDEEAAKAYDVSESDEIPITIKKTNKSAIPALGDPQSNTVLGDEFGHGLG